MKAKMRKMSPSKPITVYQISLPQSTWEHGRYGLSKTRQVEEIILLAHIEWHKQENYRWVRENAVADSVTFHTHLAHDTLDYRVAVTAQFEPEDLTYYLMAFEVA